MANAKAKLDRSKPFARISSLKPQTAVYEQDGLFFNQNEEQCGVSPGLKEKEKKAKAKEKAAKEAAEKEAEAARAENILGDLGDPNADSLMENAAAAAAESKAVED